MTYKYGLPKYYRVRERKSYLVGEKTWEIELFPEDVLTKSGNGTVMKHTGLGVFGIKVPDTDLELVDEPVMLTVN